MKEEKEKQLLLKIIEKMVDRNVSLEYSILDKRYFILDQTYNLWHFLEEEDYSKNIDDILKDVKEIK